MQHVLASWSCRLISCRVIASEGDGAREKVVLPRSVARAVV